MEKQIKAVGLKTDDASLEEAEALTRVKTGSQTKRPKVGMLAQGFFMIKNPFISVRSVLLFWCTFGPGFWADDMVMIVKD